MCVHTSIFISYVARMLSPELICTHHITGTSNPQGARRVELALASGLMWTFAAYSSSFLPEEFIEAMAICW